MRLALDRFIHRSRTSLGRMLLSGVILFGPLPLANGRIDAEEVVDSDVVETSLADESVISAFRRIYSPNVVFEEAYDPFDIELLEIDTPNQSYGVSFLHSEPIQEERDIFELTGHLDESSVDSTGSNFVEDLQNRLTELESQVEKQAESHRKAEAAAAKKFVTRPFGRIHIDAASFDQSPSNQATVGNALNGTDIRRARLGVEGEGFETFFYRFDVDFVTFDSTTNTRPVIVDAYLDTLHLPYLGNIRAGHFREPFSLERLSSTHDLPFLERSAPINTLTPFRNLGIMEFGWNEEETRTWAFGMFQENTDEFGEQLSDRSGLAFTTRHTWLPYYDELAEGRYLLHLGTSYSYRRLARSPRRFSSTPEIILKEGSTLRTPNFVDTGVLNLEDYHVVGSEVSNLWGSLSFQGEYVAAMGTQDNGEFMFLNGGYFEIGYWLTGEHKNYLRQQGIYGGTALHNNFFRVETDNCICTGIGAWEFATRVTNIDLTNNNVNGGVMTNYSVGMNWYYTFRSRVMFDFIHSNLDRNGVDSFANIFATRFQYAF